MDFFTTMLLKDSSNEWATQFLKSQAWTHLSNSSSGNCYNFSLPKSKPSVIISKLCCSDHVEEHAVPSDPIQTLEEHTSPLEKLKQPTINSSEESVGFFDPSQNLEGHTPTLEKKDQASLDPSIMTTPINKKKGTKRGKPIIISESQVRRSSRLHSQNKGFKPSLRKDKSCLGCETKPPLISTAVVRDLSASFCKVDPKSLTDEKLLSKPAAKNAVGRPKSKKAKKNGGNGGNDKPADDEAESSNSKPAEEEPGPSKKPGPKEN